MICSSSYNSFSLDLSSLVLSLSKFIISCCRILIFWSISTILRIFALLLFLSIKITPNKGISYQSIKSLLKIKIPAAGVACERMLAFHNLNSPRLLKISFQRPPGSYAVLLSSFASAQSANEYSTAERSAVELRGENIKISCQFINICVKRSKIIIKNFSIRLRQILVLVLTFLPYRSDSPIISLFLLDISRRKIIGNKFFAECKFCRLKGDGWKV